MLLFLLRLPEGFTETLEACEGLFDFCLQPPAQGGYTALMDASSNDRREIVELLGRAGASE